MIQACLKSLGDCDEIIVVDSGSTDGTLEIVKSLLENGLPIRLIHNDWPGYAKQKQFALDQCTGDWCLGIDADERLEKELAAELRQIAAKPGYNGWYLGYLPFLYGYGYPPKSMKHMALLRFVRRGTARYDLSVKVHEKLLVDGQVGRGTRGKILHRRSLPVGEQLVKENLYSSLKAQQLFDAGHKPRLLKLALNPLAYFLKTYLVRGYWKCGWAGFIHACTAATYAFMTESKLYQLHRQNAESELAKVDDEFLSR